MSPSLGTIGKVVGFQAQNVLSVIMQANPETVVGHCSKPVEKCEWKSRGKIPCLEPATVGDCPGEC